MAPHCWGFCTNSNSDGWRQQLGLNHISIGDASTTEHTSLSIKTFTARKSSLWIYLYKIKVIRGRARGLGGKREAARKMRMGQLSRCAENSHTVWSRARGSKRACKRSVSPRATDGTNEFLNGEQRRAANCPPVYEHCRPQEFRFVSLSLLRLARGKTFWQQRNSLGKAAFVYRFYLYVKMRVFVCDKRRRRADHSTIVAIFLNAAENRAISPIGGPWWLTTKLYIDAEWCRTHSRPPPAMHF